MAIFNQNISEITTFFCIVIFKVFAFIQFAPTEFTSSLVLVTGTSRW